ncbi:MAG TPA: ATP-dependent DNA helicase [Pyrinomonadaceae bacterium]|jgi:ATP-dependent DNA helicase DinG|nr:ATP-dependent DNA helicase [Pyrinomonadaceae bacterium]
MEEIFGPRGLIARAHPDYEYRPGQVQMAEAVLRAFEEGRHLIVEAGTGTGKTLAYLVPAIAAAVARGGRVVVSTGTKNLQEQLMEKDIPFLQRVLPKKFTAAYMKGRTNYVCLNRVKRAETTPILDGLQDVDHFEEVRHWSRESETGDRAELTELPENLSFWRHIDARSEICTGQKCSDYDACYITRMRQRASDADIVIVNHHLFFADLALRGGEYGQVIPDYSAVIFDEAHQVEDVAAEYFGAQVSNYQIEDMLRDLQMLPVTDSGLNRELTRASSRVARFAEQFWMGFARERAEEGRSSLVPGTFARKSRGGEIEATPLGDAYLKLDGALRQMETTLDLVREKPPEIENLLRRIRETRFNLEFIVAGDDRRYVYWVERRGRGTFLRASPIDVSTLLQDKLFDRVETVVLTSATLASAGNFDFIRRRLGLADAELKADAEEVAASSPAAGKTDELIAPSGYNYEEQAVLYLPPRMPEPRSPQWIERASEEVVELLNVSQGRAFVLSTSLSGMRALYERVAPAVDFPCFVQGSASKAGVLERFRATPHAVLFATASFWQGVDVRGEQLSCVIIDKLPFAVPTDPVVAARQRFIEEQGGSSFYEYSVPQAIITLKQGLGRLIRGATDRGLLAVLDPRLRTAGYGRLFLASLPPCRITSDLEEAAGVFDRITRV